MTLPTKEQLDTIRQDAIRKEAEEKQRKLDEQKLAVELARQEIIISASKDAPLRAAKLPDLIISAAAKGDKSVELIIDQSDKGWTEYSELVAELVKEEFKSETEYKFENILGNYSYKDYKIDGDGGQGDDYVRVRYWPCLKVSWE
jgi:hypothetical protein